MGSALASGGSILVLVGTASIGHGRSFCHLLTEATIAASAATKTLPHKSKTLDLNNNVISILESKDNILEEITDYFCTVNRHQIFIFVVVVLLKYFLSPSTFKYRILIVIFYGHSLANIGAAADHFTVVSGTEIFVHKWLMLTLLHLR